MAGEEHVLAAVQERFHERQEGLLVAIRKESSGDQVKGLAQRRVPVGGSLYDSSSGIAPGFE